MRCGSDSQRWRNRVAAGVPRNSPRSMPTRCSPSVPSSAKMSSEVWAPRLSPKISSRGRRSSGMAASRHFRACRNALFWSMPIPTRPSDMGEGRSEYCIATSATSPRVRYSSDSAVT